MYFFKLYHYQNNSQKSLTFLVAEIMRPFKDALLVHTLLKKIPLNK